VQAAPDDATSRDFIAELSAGEVVGPGAFLLGKPHAETVVAVDKLWYYSLRKADVDHLLETHQDAAFELQAALGQLIYEASTHAEPRARRGDRAAFVEELKEAMGFTPSQIARHRQATAAASQADAAAADVRRRRRRGIPMPLPRLSGVLTPGASPSLPTGPAAAAGPRYGLDKVDDVQAYLSRPDVAAACDEARVRFVEPCGPGGTDIPMRLKRHRSDADFEVVRGKVGSGRCGSCRLWLTGVPFIPPPLRASLSIRAGDCVAALGGGPRRGRGKRTGFRGRWQAAGRLRGRQEIQLSHEQLRKLKSLEGLRLLLIYKKEGP
jgi:hypothetical protein